ncbi:MAG: tetratricopeptide repeat protein [Methylococcaceae bacterium]|nr:tetratricopeptide repeat protein [Methylococcaceae bacterium]
MRSKQISNLDRLTLAIGLHQQGQLDEAEKIYRSVLKKQPSNPDALHFLGVLLHQNGQSADAISCINRALRINPQYLDARMNLGNIYKETGDMQKAADIFRMVIALTPDHANAYNNLGVVLRNRNELEESVQVLQKALELAPDNPDVLHNLGNSYQDQDEISKAADAYQRSIDLKPYQKDAYESLWKMLRRKGHQDAATNVLIKWQAVDPEDPIAKHHYSACVGGVIPDRASDAYIQETFDKFAASFDDVLTKLDYRAPELVAQALAKVFPRPASDLFILDAGCGTGLCGPLLKPYAKALIGVDLSSAMLNKAKGRKCYGKLTEADLVEFLNHDSIALDLIVSADTLCYFGELRTFFQAAQHALGVTGYLIFTLEKTETSDDKGFKLHHHGRYSHTEAYVSATLAVCGFTLQSIEHVILRQEAGEPVAGLLITAAKCTEINS